MSHNINTTDKEVLVAIDIAKLKHNVLIEFTNGKRQAFIIKNDLEGYKFLNNFLCPVKDKCLIAFEPTGNYHRTLAYYLQMEGFKLAIVSSIAGARIREAIYNSWDKNDPKDCTVILHLLKTGMTQIYYDPVINNFNDLQELSKTYYQTSLAKTKLQHSILTHYLPLYFPEIGKYLRHAKAEWFARVFKVFTTPLSITKFTFDEFKIYAWDLVGRKVAKDKWLFDLYQTAKESVGLPIMESSVAITAFRMVLSQYAYLIDMCNALEKEAINRLGGNSDYMLLQTIPGIGPILALMILSESGNLRRFKHYKQYLKFCGFDLSTYQSGNIKGVSKLSKRGNARLRYAFWLAATSAIRLTENTFRKKFENYIKKEPNNADLKRKAYTAVAAKMARVAHSLIKQGTSYRCYYSDIPSGKIPFNRAVKAC